ncbi:MAG: TonB-dependent receptor [Pseudomonadota bacterium]
MSNWKLFSGVAAASLVAAAIVAPAQAQVTTSGVRGVVKDASGTAVSDATVTVVDTRTGFTRQSSTSDSGVFSLRNMNVGGPYTVSVSADGFQSFAVENVFVQLGDVATLDLAFPSADGDRTLDTVIVSASADDLVQTAIGPSASFDLSTLQTSPVINRDLKDIIRQDPRVFLDVSNQDGIQCGGASPRFNSLTVDGIGLNDGFGLNDNGYPTERSSFPFDAIQNVSVELAPFDVNYGIFTACNINAVTKSGTNEFHGSVFYDYTDDSLQGDTLSGESIDRPAFDESRYGFTLGGPIIKDKLFFFGAYEYFEGFEIFDRGPAGSGAGTEVEGLTQADLDRIVQIANDVYDYDPGGIPGSEAVDDEKYLFRLDWNINNNHRATATYLYNNSVTPTESDGDDNEFEFTNHLYARGAELHAYTAQVFSDWTPNLSTEFRYSYNEIDFTQRSLDGSDFGEVQVEVEDATVYLGGDDSRQSNELNYDVTTLYGAASYLYSDHLITVGAERLEYNIFNLFAQHTEGQWEFDTIDDFENGVLETFFYGNAASGNPADTSQEFAYEVNTLFVQDEFQLNGNLTVTAGLRYDYYTSDDEPVFNQNFVDRNGFDNTKTFDGESLLQPRLGLTYDVNDRLSLRGGLGLYSGGNPNVWLSNSFSNDGISNIQENSFGSLGVPGNLLDGSVTFVNDEEGLGRPIYGIPEDYVNAVENGTANSSVNAIDPDIEIPNSWKYAAGFTYDLDLPGKWGQGYRIDGDILYTDIQASFAVQDISRVVSGTAPDGRPIYTPTFGSRTNDFLLTNGETGSELVLSGSISKSYYDMKWADSLDWSLAYAYTDAENSASQVSAVAFSNYTGTATTDPNNLPVTTSNYEIPHRFTAKVSWEKAFFGEYVTRATLFGQAYQGPSQSFTFGGDAGDVFGDVNDFRNLLYVPTGPDDPLVEFGPDFDTDAFFAYVDDQGLTRGQITGRNDDEGQWTNQFDLYLEQEFPGAQPSHRTKGFITIENVGNLINDDWGQVYEASFFQTTSIVDLAGDLNAQGQYVYEEFRDRDAEARVTEESFWSLRIGVRYEF